MLAFEQTEGRGDPSTPYGCSQCLWLGRFPLIPLIDLIGCDRRSFILQLPVRDTLKIPLSTEDLLLQPLLLDDFTFVQ